ncbi:MAG: hypothetical protein IMZ62_04610 [Chloroflexi bacterium]|nr:hypothetical protein [Chloroflexota bacterium]
MADKETKSTLEFLYNVSRELASALELRTVLQRILFQSLKYVGGERASIVVLDDNGKAVDSAIVYGRKIHDHTSQQLRETVERGLGVGMAFYRLAINGRGGKIWVESEVGKGSKFILTLPIAKEK